LETAQPYPGYHGTNLPEIYNPESFFIVTKEKYKDEKIVRTIMETRKNVGFSFDGAPGTIINHQEFYNVIRIRDIKSVYLSVLVEEFQKQGVELMRYKKLANVIAFLKIRKFFRISELAQGIFRDMDQKFFSYLHIPHNLSWDDFKTMTLNLKYNIEDNNFDAAQAHIYYEDGLIDLVRIFDYNASLEKLTFIRDKYLEYISKL
ncbi:MAG: hypothetical protein IH595_01965, partial [Bacteroidales bacterium]|nr:hypothetical protein [Bacteroidales bacterium]